MPPAFGREPKKTRKQLYQVLSLSLSLSLFSQADDKWRKTSRAEGDGVHVCVLMWVMVSGSGGDHASFQLMLWWGE